MSDDAICSLKIFISLSLREIAEIEKRFNAAHHERLVQKILAYKVVALVHGEEAYRQALKITKQLLAGNAKSLPTKGLRRGLNNVPNYAVQADDNRNIVEVLVAAKASPSKRQAREDVRDGVIYINGERIQDLAYTPSDDNKTDNELTVIYRGKKKYLVLIY